MKLFLIAIRKFIYRALYSFDLLVDNKSKISILCYHGISDEIWRYNTKKEIFESQINSLLEKGYKFIRLSDITNKNEGNSVVLTFDDGYKSVLNVKEFLKSKSIFPTMFLITDYGNYDPEGLGNTDFKPKDFLSLSETLELKDAGWSFGSHTQTHKLLPTLTLDEQKEELLGSKEYLEKALGTEIIAISYPRGQYTKDTIDIARNIGYKFGLTMDDGYDFSNLLKLPRVGVDITHSSQEVLESISPSVIAFRSFIKKYLFKFISGVYLK